MKIHMQGTVRHFQTLHTSTAGFYGVVIGVEDDTVVVEFGNNKNCRIPMQKAAIVEIEKADDEN